jgi:uncharacterized coiled-coil DUF342 family protein
MALSKQTERNPHLKQAIQTRVYVLMRLAELTESLKSYGSERADLNRKIQDMPADSSPELRKLRDRRTYVSKRIEILRGEQKDLQAQKKAVNETIVKLKEG